MIKERLDLLVVERRLVESRTKAQWLIRNGFVCVNGIEIRKPGKRIDNSLKIELIKEFPYVGRGGLKLEAALKEFSLIIKGKVCADIGASVGGFTDCLLKHYASKVYAIDTAQDLLHPSLRCDKMRNRVIPLLGVDARNLEILNEKVDICTIDVTFTSLKAILPNVRKFLKNDGRIIALIKPLFETELKKDIQSLTIVKYNKIRNKDLFRSTEKNLLKDVVENLVRWCIDEGFFPYGLMRSPSVNRKKSVEFIIYLKVDKRSNFFNYRNEINKLFT